MKHTKLISKEAGVIPKCAQSYKVCGMYEPTGKTKCVPINSPKAAKITDIPEP
jgi:hypothetical protein